MRNNNIQMGEWRLLKMSSNLSQIQLPLYGALSKIIAYGFKIDPGLERWRFPNSPSSNPWSRTIRVTTNAGTMWLVSKQGEGQVMVSDTYGMEEEQLEKFKRYSANRNPRSEIEEKSGLAVHRNCHRPWAHATYLRSLPYPSLLPTSPWSDLYDNHSRWIKRDRNVQSLISRRWVYDYRS